MDATVVAILCFSAIMFFVIALFLALRDLRQPATAAVGVSGGRARRQYDVFDQAPATGLSRKFDQAFERLVLESGSEMTPGAVFLLLVACGLLLGGVLFLVYDHPLVGIAGMGVGMLAPLVIFVWQRVRRMRRIREELPHVIDLLARAVRAGESLDQAVHLIGAEFEGPLGSEFRRASKQMELGRDISTIMHSMAKRIRLTEIRMLATVLIVHRQTGGSLPVALERLAAVIRSRINYRRQMMAATGAGRLSAFIIASAAPILYIGLFLWRPEHFGILWEDQIGRILLGAAMVLEIVGIVWVWRILKID